MNVLVFNCGSSSLKYRLISMPSEKELAGGEAQRVGPPTAEPARIVHRYGDQEDIIQVEMKDHREAFQQVMKILSEQHSIQPDAVGHRVVHGGTWFTDPVLVNKKVLADLEETRSLAPLHNPPAMNLIYACEDLYPDLRQVAVFDTAYHSTIPEHARTYAIPERISREFQIRKYGFHGISHQFVIEEAARFLDKPVSRFNGVSCHLGSGGASLCAVKNGKSMDNTMGFSPLQGLVMSTRCGDIDPAIALKLMSFGLGDTKSVEKLFNKKSGVLGLSGESADIRDILAVPSDRGVLARTRDIYLWRIRKYLGAYLAVVGNADAVIFTDTIGETVPEVREKVLSGMQWFGIRLDHRANQALTGYPTDIATKKSPVRILVIQTNEELAIARKTHETLTTPPSNSRKEYVA